LPVLHLLLEHRQLHLEHLVALGRRLLLLILLREQPEAGADRGEGKAGHLENPQPQERKEVRQR
jgi:hypothetical protein